MAILAVLATATISVVDQSDNQARYDTTKARAQAIHDAILGPGGTLNGGPVVSGFVADMGRLPMTLSELTSISSFTPAALYGGTATSTTLPNAAPLTATFLAGWRGPYLTPDADGTFRDGVGNVMATTYAESAANPDGGRLRLGPRAAPVARSALRHGEQPRRHEQGVRQQPRHERRSSRVGRRRLRDDARGRGLPRPCHEPEREHALHQHGQRELDAHRLPLPLLPDDDSAHGEHGADDDRVPLDQAHAGRRDGPAGDLAPPAVRGLHRSLAPDRRRRRRVPTGLRSIMLFDNGTDLPVPNTSQVSITLVARTTVSQTLYCTVVGP